MGSSHSQPQRPLPTSTSKRSLSHRISQKLSCISDSTSEASFPSSRTLTIREKASFTHDTPRVHHIRLHPPHDDERTDSSDAYLDFLNSYPEYYHTWIIDSLRKSEFSRLSRTGETYVDYMGSSLYPESLLRYHYDFLTRNVFGNTHSVSNSSELSASTATEARAAVLSFFQASASDYTVIFTANATAAMKLIGESFPFELGSSYVLGTDSHNSLNGIRRFADSAGAKICYIPTADRGGLDPQYTQDVLSGNASRDHPSLFALTGLSNISNAKNPLTIASRASELGYFTLLDAAALAATSSVSLREYPVDAMAVSFYKMFGFPTGVGALIVKKSFLRILRRPWFAGGSVNVVQVPGTLVTMAQDPHEQFEDGTINFLGLTAITQGIQFLAAYMPFLPVRLTALTHHLTAELANLKHEKSGTPIVSILSQPPPKRIMHVGEQSTTGATVSLIFLSPEGEMIPNSFIEHAASRQKISLRTGCVCNPGGAAKLLGIEQHMEMLSEGTTLKELECRVGRELGVVRISLGLVSSFDDVWRLLQFARAIASEDTRQKWWAEWSSSSTSST